MDNTNCQHSDEESSIVTYHIGEGSIIVIYTGCGYLYNSIKPGIAIVNQMIELAKAGAKKGLGEYIKIHAQDNYYQRLV
ncbi:MAG: hypothetical protein V4651_00415 [Bacteroidota bacterium]